MSAQTSSSSANRWLVWQRRLRPYTHVDKRRAWAQLLTTSAGYAVVVSGMVWMVLRDIPYVFVLMASIVAAGLLIRLFIFFHDACHHALFKSNLGNDTVGHILGVLVFTPYHAWRSHHLRHHTTVADLDRRGAGDVWTMTVDEYRAASPLVRATYHLFRHPLVLFGLVPVVNFCLLQRIPEPNAGRRQNVSVYLNDLAILGIVALASLTIGFRAYVAVQLPIIAIAASAGTWLFYVQHQFAGVYWARHEEWDPVRASIEGSSFYRLPRLLQWVSGNIGYHHVHHLSPRMPNYHLERAYDEVPELRQVKPLRLRDSLRCVRLNLWDERQGKLVSFRSLRRVADPG